MRVAERVACRGDHLPCSILTSSLQEEGKEVDPQSMHELLTRVRTEAIKVEGAMQLLATARLDNEHLAASATQLVAENQVSAYTAGVCNLCARACARACARGAHASPLHLIAVWPIGKSLNEHLPAGAPVLVQRSWWREPGGGGDRRGGRGRESREGWWWIGVSDCGIFAPWSSRSGDVLDGWLHSPSQSSREAASGSRGIRPVG